MLFNIVDDTLNGRVDSDKLKLEISSSSISQGLENIGTEGLDLNLNFNGELTPTDISLLTAIVNNHDGDAIPEELAPTEVRINNTTLIQDAVPVALYKPEDPSYTSATHDFTNKTTWYTNSVRLEDEVLTTSDDLTYSAVNDFFIDVVNAIINRQDLHQDKKIFVKVDDVLVTDFTIDHRAGTIAFPTAQTGSIVKCTYNYATNSEWIIGPGEGELMIIEHSEVQFAKDVVINTPLRFEVWVGNPYYATVGHPYEGMPKIPYSNIQYNSIRDLINEANLGTGYIPQMGDLPDDILVFPFNYVSVKPFRASLGAELRLRSVGDLELTGSYGTATFYLITREDS